jgi:hypothetical protein
MMRWFTVSVIRADTTAKTAYSGPYREQATTCYRANYDSADCLVGVMFVEEPDGLKTIVSSFNRVNFDAQ